MNVGEIRKVSVATAGDPQGQMLRVCLEYATGPYVMDVAVAHDDGCPCELGGGSTRLCTCEIINITLTRVA